MAGFAVGIVDKSRIIDGSKVAEGNVIIGLPSSGIHSNGYSLVRKIFFDRMNMDVADYVEELNTTLGDALITPTRIYVRPAKAVFEKYAGAVNGVVHITGGGFYENIPRILPEGLCAEITAGTWDVLPIFNYIQKCGNIELKEMFSTFNMGIGMMMAVDEDKADKIVSLLRSKGENPSVIGRIVKGEGVRIIKDGEVL
jgi:phosphoribosylformylglycinamidine cyclo-ligase